MQENIRFASSGDDVKIWDSSSVTVVEQFNPHASSNPVNSLCWGSNNNFLVSASVVGDKIVVSSCKGKPVPLFDLAEGARQTCVSLNSSSTYIASGGLDNTVNIWDLKSKKLYRCLKDHKDEITCVTFNWNDCYIASGSMSGEIILHSVTTNLSSTPFGHGSSQPIRHLKYSSFKKSLLGSVSDSGTVTLWDVNSQNPYHTFENTHKAPASEICFSPVNELLFVTVGLDKRIILYDTSSKKQLRTLVAESPLTAVDFMPEGTTLAIGSSRGKIYHYDLRKLTSPVKTVSAHKTSVKCITLQYNSTFSKSSLNKVSSNKLSSKRTDVRTNSNTGGIPNAGIIKNLTSNMPATFLPLPISTTESKEADVVQDKTGFPRSSSLDVIPSKETDHRKTSDLTNFDDLGRNSLGDMFSPVRDDVAVHKTNEDLPGKGDGKSLDFQPYLSGLDFLPQFNTTFVRKKPIGASMQGTRSSPLHVFVGSPIKEEEENPDAEAKRINSGKQESRESLKQVLCTRRPGQGPKITSSVTAGVASSLSDKIVDTIGSSRPNAPLTSVQIHFIQNMIQDTLDYFREACHRDIVNLQVEMIKQFHMQLNEMHALLERYSVNESLVAEIEKLREENKRLRTHF
uniref:Protein NEDD1 n=1 Tax=Sphenodon punctatus TaxID=8508 RepID=A0A8D0LC60_SPHPU